MNSRTSTGCVALLLALMATPVLAQEQTPEEAQAASHDRPLSHHLMVGIGTTYSGDGPNRQPLHPGAMLGVNMYLGRHAALGLTGDFTYIGESTLGARYELLTGLDLKILPVAHGATRFWISAGTAASLVDDLKLGFGLGAGMYFLPNNPRVYFVDVRHYRMSGMETVEYGQTLVRAGVAF